MTQGPARSSLPARAPSDARLAGWLLALGVVLGAASGVFSARHSARGTTALPPGVAAWVDGRPIRSEDYARAVEMLAGDRREPLSPQERARVLERLIDEELLVESALARGFLASERSVRDAVTLAMVDSVGADSASRAATPEELRASFDAVRAAAGDPTPAESFESLRESLEAVVSARARASALRDYLQELRARARIGCGEGAEP